MTKVTVKYHIKAVGLYDFVKGLRRGCKYGREFTSKGGRRGAYSSTNETFKTREYYLKQIKTNKL